MDQLKAHLAAVKQHSFWAMCIGILVVSGVSWYMSVSKLDQERNQRKGEIDGVFSKLQSLRTANQVHPNEVTNQGMDKMNLDLANEIAEGWRKQYELQEKVLVWPSSFDQEFHDAVNPLRPIETISLNYGIDKALPVGMLDEYRNYLDPEFHHLAKIIGAEWKAVSMPSDNSGFGGGFGEGAMPGAGLAEGGQLGADGRPLVVDTSIVHWRVENQQELLAGHFGFIARTERPTTLEVLYAQEDLWVLNALMNIIAKANGGAEARHEAAIKEIDFVRIGRTAMGRAGVVKPIGTPRGGMGGGMDPSMAGAEGGMPGAEGAMADAAMPADGMSADGMAMPGGEGGMPGGTAGGKVDPAEGRYVDTNYLPLPATRLRNALTSTDPKDAILAVAKRVPVRMRFRMDQRKLNVLLAECGNSSLPVEVRQVRINRDPAAVGSGSMGGGGYGGGEGMAMPGSTYSGEGAAMPGGEAGYGMEGMGGRSAQRGSITADATVDGNLVNVEVYGIVYIYNPVNKAQLGIAETTTTVSTPVPELTPTSGG